MKNIGLTILCLLSVTLAKAQSIGKPQGLKWAKQMASTEKVGTQNNCGLAIVTDKLGNVYTTGTFQGTMDFDPDSFTTFNLTNLYGADIYISKLDASGNFIWVKQMKGDEKSAYGFSQSIGLDNQGNVYITGYFRGSIDFDPNPLVNFNLTSTGFDDIFVLKLDNSGNFVWAKTMGGPSSDDIGESILLDNLGGIYLGGSFVDSADFDPTSGTYNLKSNGWFDAFICKLDISGNLLWVKNVGGELVDWGHSIGLDPSGNIYASGTFMETADFDPGSDSFNLTAIDDYENFILKLDPLGNFIWAKQMGRTTHDNLPKLSLDASGNIYTTGHFIGTADFDPGTGVFNLTAIGDNDIFISKLDPYGNFVWAKKIGGFGGDGGIRSDRVSSLALDVGGNIYTTGCFYETVDFDPGPGIFNLTASGLSAAFILKLDALGNFVWVKKIDGTSTISGPYTAYIYVDALDNVYTTGSFQGTVDFGLGDGIYNVISAGLFDIFVCKMHQDSCSKMALVIDSIRNGTCNDSVAFVSSHSIYGSPPYNYVWDTKPSIKDSIATFSISGIYSLNVTDANRCVRRTSIFVRKPTSNLGFDLNCNMAAQRFRPGRQNYLFAEGLNERCQSVNGLFSIVLDKLVTYNNASPNPDKISGDTLIWNFSNLAYDSKPINPTIDITTNTKATLGDTVCFDILITPIVGDANHSNNKKRYCYPVVNSYDPNIKSVYPPGTCQQAYVLKNKPLTYTVQFQNTGNAEAIDIYILDTLDPHLDIKSLRVIGQSHKAPITEILPGRVLKLRFDNINLPDSFSNEKGSHGYVIYEVMPDSNVANGTPVKGKAGIYFDFNPPVFTNMVNNTLTNSIPSCNLVIKNPPYSKPVKIYPNPNTGNFIIEIDNPTNNISIAVYNLLGEKIKTVETSTSKTSYSVDLNLANGLYMVKVINGEMVYNQKIIITK